MKNTIYIIGEGNAKTYFDEQFALFQQGQGWYYDNGFSNWGAIRFSLDNTKVLLEEEQSKFLPADLAREDVTIYTETEIQQYLQDNVNDWEAPIEEE